MAGDGLNYPIAGELLKLKGKSEVDGHSGLACSSFTAGDRDDHGMMIFFPSLFCRSCHLNREVSHIVLDARSKSNPLLMDFLKIP